MLFGIHTYLARRYHETVNMLEPARSALRGLERMLAEDSKSTTPVLGDSSISVQYLSFQAEFLSSRAKSRELDPVDALRQLRNNSLVEATVGAVILGIVSALGTLPPGLHEQATWPFAISLNNIATACCELPEALALPT